MILIRDNDFYKRDTVDLAIDLLGKILEVNNKRIITSGRITEVEAYLPKGDLACHAATKMTKRNAVMFNEGGSIYVYKIYGIHHCVNIVSGRSGEGCAVLIRALEPINGIDIMKARRNRIKNTELCSGPAKLVEALGIDINDNGIKINEDKIFLYKDSYSVDEIKTSSRIGISKSKDLQLRFFIDSNFLSRKA